jgi:hypothetical protein
MNPKKTNDNSNDASKKRTADDETAAISVEHNDIGESNGNNNNASQSGNKV